MYTYALRGVHYGGEPVSNWVGIPLLVLIAGVCIWALWPRK
ncbi:hypothetical protein OG746_37345 [Streptomyces sp. NBC_01016]|nr:hypothetical protein [Streptomyces sp. NBC_01016]MCX4834391.1 hypothetical protein [Streptomyces sp. NBC_01016]